MKRNIIILLILIPFLNSCLDFCEVYNCVIDGVESSRLIPQEGTIVEIPYSYVLVETKTTPAQYFQPFRYRASVDGKQYSYAETPSYAVGYSASFFVVVPRNNSYDSRNVTIDVSLALDRDRADWDDWRTAYSGTQEGLDKDQSLRPATSDRGVCLVLDGLELNMELADNESVRCLKDVLLDGDILHEVRVNCDLIASEPCEGVNYLCQSVPLNHTTLTRINRGDVYMTDCGVLYIENKNVKRGLTGRWTYMGKLTGSSLDLLDEICCGSDRFYEKDTYPMTIGLK